MSAAERAAPTSRLTRAERRVLVALRSGPALRYLVQYAAELTGPRTRAVLLELRERELVERVAFDGLGDTWSLTPAGRELVT